MASVYRRGRPITGEIGRLMAALFPGRRFPPVVALAAYFDESKEGDSFALAGYIGVVEEWDGCFSPAWRRIIETAPHPIPEFKASDCRHQKGKFKGWDKSECDALTSSCVDLILNRSISKNIVGVGIGIVKPSYAPNPEESGYDLIHGVAVAHLLKIIIAMAASNLSADRVMIICDKQPKVEQKLKWLFEMVIEDCPGMDRIIDGPVFKHSDEVEPLQAADLLAYETWKELKNRSETPPRRPSRALERLVSGRLHVAYRLDQDFGAYEERYNRRKEAGLDIMSVIDDDIPMIYGRGGIIRHGIQSG